jgi:hypothetical protein
MILDNFIEVARRFESIPSSWEIFSKREVSGEWVISASIWMDNGYGGKKSSLEVKNKSLLKAMKEVLDKIDEHTKLFGNRYH